MNLTQSDNKRVAKNTVLLYGRMLLLLAVSLYTSRVVLSALGFEDYGIYNVVGGIVAMFSFINMALANSTSRFITFSLGKGNLDESRQVFNSCFIVHIIIALIILLLCETIGLWFLYNKMVIPDTRMYAALWVYQFSVIACVSSILYAPFNAIIIAHEKMGAFALISILDALLKLFIAFSISVYEKDRLIMYAFLLLCISITDIIIYLFYCKRKFQEVRFEKVSNIKNTKEILGFAGWSLIGNLAFVGYTQGLNILLNVFFGPVVNAARGVAAQLQNAVMGFVSNFQMAVNPQITKSYAQEDFNRMHTLVYASSKFSFFLLFCIILPLSIESKTILSIWLVDVPNYAVQFTILTLFARLVDTLSNPIGIANNATGSIRKYQIYEGGCLLLIVPIAYLVLKMGGDPTSVFWVQLIIMYAVQGIRLMLVCGKINMPKKEYCKKVIMRIIPVALVSAISPLLLHHFLPPNLITSIIVVVVSIFSVILFSYIWGLENNERKMLQKKLLEIRKSFNLL